jgi:hypothetical protein
MNDPMRLAVASASRGKSVATFPPIHATPVVGAIGGELEEEHGVVRSGSRDVTAPAGEVMVVLDREGRIGANEELEVGVVDSGE